MIESPTLISEKRSTDLGTMIGTKCPPGPFTVSVRVVASIASTVAVIVVSSPGNVFVWALSAAVVADHHRDGHHPR